MRVDLSALHKILRDPTRRDILLHLSRNDPLTYVELMDFLKITNTGKFNYHLKILGDLIEKGEDGKYRLTEKGNTAIELLEKFSEKNSKGTQSSLEKVANVPESPRTSRRPRTKHSRLYIGIALILIVIISVPLSTYAVANNIVAHALDETSVTTGSQNAIVEPTYVEYRTYFFVTSNEIDNGLTLNINITIYVESIDQSAKYIIGNIVKNETVKGYTQIGIPSSFNLTSEKALNIFHSEGYSITWLAELTASDSYLFWHVTQQRTYP
jgi:hypothetical protein